MNWRLLIVLMCCAGAAVAWREIDDWRDRRRTRTARAEREILIAHAWTENVAFDELAAKRRVETEKQFRVTPRSDRRRNRAA